MRPWQHAQSSIVGGGAWSDALELHEFLDISKAGCADRRHRIVLHHVDLGLAIARRAFPARTDLETLVRQHVEEDLGRPATLADWLDLVDRDGLPLPARSRISGGRTEVAAMVADRLHPTQHHAVEDVCVLLFAPRDFYPADPERALPVLMNTIGPVIARRVFGPPSVTEGEGRRIVTDWAWIAEAVIMTCFGRIPDLSEIVSSVRSEPVSRTKMRKRARQ